MLNIKVVGGGCPNCDKLASMCEEVLEENNIVAEIEKVTDFNTFADLGVMMTPALIVNGEIKSSGKLPTKPILENWIKSADTKE